MILLDEIEWDRLQKHIKVHNEKCLASKMSYNPKTFGYDKGIPLKAYMEKYEKEKEFD